MDQSPDYNGHNGHSIQRMTCEPPDHNVHSIQRMTCEPPDHNGHSIQKMTCGPATRPQLSQHTEDDMWTNHQTTMVTLTAYRG